VHFLQPLLGRTVQPLGLYVDGRDTPLAGVLETAFDSLSRRKGLLDRDHLPEGVALVIAPCSAIHTFGMRFAIDVIFAARDGRIVKLRPALRSSRLSAALRSFAVVEMAAGAIRRSRLQVGDRLTVR
jgi:uncharacterized protein